MLGLKLEASPITPSHSSPTLTRGHRASRRTAVSLEKMGEHALCKIELALYDRTGTSLPPACRHAGPRSRRSVTDVLPILRRLWQHHEARMAGLLYIL